jgi:hypothetical protein
MNLTGAYLKARKQHYKNATEWGMIWYFERRINYEWNWIKRYYINDD